MTSEGQRWIIGAVRLQEAVAPGFPALLLLWPSSGRFLSHPLDVYSPVLEEQEQGWTWLSCAPPQAPANQASLPNLRAVTEQPLLSDRPLVQLAAVATQDRIQEDSQSPSGQLAHCVSSRFQHCLLGMSGPHTRALSPDPGIAQARLETGKLGPRQGGVEASPENVFRLSQSRWGAVTAYRPQQQQGRRLRSLPTRREAREGRQGLSLRQRPD